MNMHALWNAFNINLHNLVRSTRIIKDNRIQRFCPAHNWGQSRRKAQKKIIFSDFDLNYVQD